MHVINSTFTNNTVTNGHSGAVGGSTVNVSGCTFINNTASIDGGALGAGTSTINSCTFLNNRAGRNGGAISTGDSTVHFCRFVGNNAPQLGSTFTVILDLLMRKIIGGVLIAVHQVKFMVLSITILG